MRAIVRPAAPRRRRDSVAFWSLVTAVSLFLVNLLPGAGSTALVGAWSALVLWALLSLPRLFRWMRWRLLWRLRNRLFVTYLLVGLTPVVLFGLLAGFASYVLFGQFANFAATSEINTQLAELAAENEALALHFQQFMLAGNSSPHASAQPQTLNIPTQVPAEARQIMAMPELRVGVFIDGHPQALNIPASRILSSVSTPPAWVNHSFRGLALSHDHVYFRAINREQAGSHTVTVITSLPLDTPLLGRIVSGLGLMTLWPSIHLKSRLSSISNTSAPVSFSVESGKSSAAAADDIVDDNTIDTLSSGARPGQIAGGQLPKAAHLFDISINFPATLNTVEWPTGQPTTVLAIVTSRPSLLYQRLFRESLLIGTSMRVALIFTAVVFALLELLAIVLAGRLSRTITLSVSNLYHATREVDQGRFDYRIPVTRQDQLAALSSSFNTMSASLVRLLKEQKEKDRLQNELDIAQEVQANLFPRSDVRVGGLELHGLCRPARTVSGDYYDFLLLDDRALCLALGDISGKGISAALLMASLHSAVRAYRFASEEIYNEQRLQAGWAGDDCVPDVFESPGNLMRLLNLHLYRTTQQEKYATLFLAHYDAASHVIRYSNGGQLPPLLLRADGSLLRLDQGGTVVGLLDNMVYGEGAITLEQGDLLIAYSDGVTEPENDFGDFGEERLVELVHANRDRPLKEITGIVIRAIDDWIGGAEQPDDITLVLARQH